MDFGGAEGDISEDASTVNKKVEIKYDVAGSQQEILNAIENLKNYLITKTTYPGGGTAGV